MNDVSSCHSLVEAIKKYKILYDSNETDYHVKHKQEAAWLAVANEVRAPVGCCKEKWKNLRAAFSRHMRNVIASEAGGKLKKPYYMAQYMSFLIPHTKQRPTTPNHNCSFNTPTKELKSSDQNEDSRDIKIEQCFEFVDESYTEASLDSIIHVEDPLQNSPLEPYVQKETNTNEKDSKAENKATKRKFEQNSSISGGDSERDKQITYDEGNDPDLCFLKSLLPEIKMMKRSQKNKFKVIMINTIEEILNDEE